MYKRNALIACLLVLAPLAGARGEEAARLAPADAGVFVQVDGLAALRARLADDPLYKWLEERLAQRPEPEGWLNIQAAMGMSGQEIIDTYFGKRFVIIASEPGAGKPGVVLTQVAQNDAQAVIQRLDLVDQGRAGAFHLYTSKDDKAMFGFHDPWMAFTGPHHRDYLEKVLSRDSATPSLADDATFKAWIARLPADRVATVFARRPAPGDSPAGTGEIHALALTLSDRQLSLHYAGRPGPRADEFFKLARPGKIDFGPVPGDALAAAAINLAPRPRNTRLLDRLLAPQSFARDLEPQLDDHLLVFAAAIQPPPSTQPSAPALTFPALGVALKLRDSAAADALQRVMNSIVLLANIRTADWNVDAIDTTTHEYRGQHFTIADIGTPLAQRAQRPELANLHLVWGRVGHWFVLCTHEALFRQCLDAHADPARSLNHRPEAAALSAQPEQVVAGLIHSPALAQLLQEWTQYFETQHGAALAAAATRPGAPLARFHKAMKVLLPLMQNSRGFTFHLTTSKDHTLQGELTLLRK